MKFWPTLLWFGIKNVLMFLFNKKREKQTRRMINLKSVNWIKTNFYVSFKIFKIIIHDLKT